MLARAHLELGDAAKARISIAPFWHSEPLDAVTEAAILTQFGTVLTKGDHRLRLEAMLYGGRNGSAERIAERAGAKELTQAWIAASRRAPNALTLIDAVPAEQSSTGLIFAKARLLRQLRRYREAAKVMRSLPKDPLTNAGSRQWWTERRLLSRLLLDQGDAKLAYEVAANHGATNPVDIADAEFHAGWYGLRQLRDADKAEPHFRRILAVADGPISRARAHYWLGRAAEAAGQSGEEHYRRASRYGTTFSGQLASAKLGLKTLTLTSPTVSEADRARFASREAVFAIERLEQAGHGWRAHALYIALAEELNSPGELALLASMAQKSGNHHMALKVAKAAANRGMDVGALTHPVGAVPPGAMIDGAGSALVYAIARQESEFNTGAVSPAGARGLLQLMPQTAQSLAGQSGLTYSAERLTNDVAFNAQLGSQFLAEQLGRFDGSYVLTFAGYNAGPSRARQWMEKYGDPRGKSVEEIVDWIERIPFQETRAYVQRVMENYQVYKAQLTGQSDIEADLRIGRK
jgi:soluble lytic murein transglycosylase